MMRIITGSARGTHLQTLQGDTTRPTSERAKEALFSMLQQKPVGARVLDLFAGSGQLGLEALSRGAALAVLADASAEAVAVIRRNAEKTHLEARARILRTDALAYLRTCRDGPFDLVFLDPPYAAGLLPACLSALWMGGLLSPNAVVVAESGAAGDVAGSDESLASKYEILKQNRYGAAFVTLLRPVFADQGE
jgi:16S rRNA (guanine(966)-N(2))-methyltransferase RsmD